MSEFDLSSEKLYRCNFLEDDLKATLWITADLTMDRAGIAIIIYGTKDLQLDDMMNWLAETEKEHALLGGRRKLPIGVGGYWQLAVRN